MFQRYMVGMFLQGVKNRNEYSRYCDLLQSTTTLLKRKELHDAIEEPFLYRCFHKEPLTAETKGKNGS